MDVWKLFLVKLLWQTEGQLHLLVDVHPHIPADGGDDLQEVGLRWHISSLLYQAVIPRLP